MFPNIFRSGGNSSYDSSGWPTYCPRQDGRDLIKEWKAFNKQGNVVRNKKDLLNLEKDKCEKILGLFSLSYMPYDDELDSYTDSPSLLNMTSVAIDCLMQRGGEKGFFLMVEAGRIDHAHHDSQAVRAIGETLALDTAVQDILEKVNLDETLVIVTADHSHTMAIGGYPGRSADISGISQGDKNWVMKADDGKPFPVLGYSNGPGFKKLRVNQDTDAVDWHAIERSEGTGGAKLGDPEFVYPGAVPLTRETHGGDDVGVWASGPWAHLFQGVQEQTHIADVMSLAGCIGPHKDLCGVRKRNKE